MPYTVRYKDNKSWSVYRALDNTWTTQLILTSEQNSVASWLSTRYQAYLESTQNSYHDSSREELSIVRTIPQRWFVFCTTPYAKNRQTSVEMFCTAIDRSHDSTIDALPRFFISMNFGEKDQTMWWVMYGRTND